MERFLMFVFVFGQIYTTEAAENQNLHLNPNLNPGLNNVFEGDILLSPEQKKLMDKIVEKQMASPDVPVKIDDFTSKFKVTNVFPIWPNGVIVYQFSGLGYAQLTAVKAAMASWTKVTSGCIKFKARTNERNYLKIFIGNGCNCHLGYPNGESRLSVGQNCQFQHVMEHELGHAIGFWHEQSRPDRDDYLEVLWQNIPTGFREAFAKYGNDKITSLGVPFDYTSIMQYPWNAFSTVYGKNTLRPKKTVPYPGPYKRISPADILAARRHYGCEKWDKGKGGGDKTKDKTDPNCVETNGNCAGWKTQGYCTSNAFVKKNCKKTCGLCVEKKKEDKKEDKKDGDCTDSESSCSSWAGRGECGKNPNWMNKNCKKSCNQCAAKKTDPPVTSKPVTVKPTAKPTEKTPTGPCDDKQDFCSFIKSYCLSNTWVKVNCLKSCDLCPKPKPPKPQCEDDNESCTSWKNSGYCTDEKYKIYMKKNCPCACA